MAGVIGWCAAGPRAGLSAAEESSSANSAKPSADSAPAGQPGDERDFAANVRPYLEKYCFDCHGPVVQEDGVSFHQFGDAASARAAHKLWKKAADRLRFDSMPPDGHDPRPSANERDALLRWLEEKVFAVDCAQIDDPGRETIRRLNRAEYDNTIRDLIGLPIRAARDFPSDDVGEGFDNIGDVLSLSPLLLEKYLDAAEKVAETAIDGKAFEPFVKRFRADDLDVSTSDAGRRQEALIGLWSNGEAFTTIEVPTSGEYIFRVEAEADQAGREKAKMAFVVDGRTIETITVTNGREQGKVYEAKFKAQKGRRRIAAAFINDYYNPDAPDRRDRDRNLYVRWIEIARAGVPAWESRPEPHRRIVFVRPGEGVSLTEAAAQVVRRFASRAFRRPATDDEVARYVRLIEAAVARGDTFEEGVQLAVQAILVSPHFLFRVERDPRPDDPGAVRELTDYEIASRLSYFLWSSMPDEELFALAEKGELRNPAVLDAQLRRMLRDEKARALAENFGGQWLNLSRHDEFSPDPEIAGRFGTQLREDMRRETLLFFEAVMREDRPISDFLLADYTFVNERLAKHYGIEGVQGEEFRRVSLKGLSGQERSGVLTHASVLSLTSNPRRTSPVLRGKWILENMLGSAPPPPPAGVPDLEVTQKAHEGATLRQQLEIHRASPTCASCHVTMDAIGFGFENFDILGRWRTEAGGHPVDASGELPSGEKFSGPLELVEILGKRQADFSRCLTEKMLVYALGRGLRPYDRCTVDEIVARLARDGGRFSGLVSGIVHSDPFLKRRGDGGQP